MQFWLELPDLPMKHRIVWLSGITYHWAHYRKGNTVTEHTGCPKKNASKIVWIISPTTNMLEGWDIFNLKGGIHCSVWSTKTFLYNIREPRYEQNNMGYQISMIWNDKQSNILKSQRFIHNFSFILGGLDTSHFKGDFLWHISGSNLFLYNIA